MARRAPVLIYDADCGFCRSWIARWRRSTGDRVRYLPYQRARVRWRHRVSKRAARAASQLVEPDGRRYAGAAAMFRALLRARPPWLRAAARVGLMPGVRLGAALVYRAVAAHRRGASRLQRRIERVLHPRARAGSAVPRHLPRRSLWTALSRPGLALRGLGLVYLVAFTSLRAQVLGLYGRRGIQPVRRASDQRLVRLCALGQVAGVALAAGVAPRLAAAVAWGSYLWFVSAGRDLLRFQWDALLLEAGLQAMLGRPRRLLMRTLAFRLQLESGLAKLASRDPTWRDLSACCYHQETQPLPTPAGWYAHHLPRRVQELGTATTLIVECVVPFLAFGPRPLRRLAFAVLTGFQGLIALTGNYAFFNWLTAILNLALIEEPAPTRVARGADDLLAAALLALGASELAQRLRPGVRPPPAALERLAVALAPYHAVSSYGLFAVMTTSRPEIVIEGSNDGEEWREYGFRYKPGDVMRAPRWVAPHQPRLDWQMWFAALGYPPAWFVAFLARLLEGSPEVLALLETNPFPERPPRYLRALLYDYAMTDLGTHRRTGAWWSRTLIGVYFPACSK
jgi:predicted DCC family thiol-disulfide oxidoreductase YuxK